MLDVLLDCWCSKEHWLLLPLLNRTKCDEQIAKQTQKNERASVQQWFSGNIELQYHTYHNTCLWVNHGKRLGPQFWKTILIQTSSKPKLYASKSFRLAAEIRRRAPGNSECSPRKKTPWFGDHGFLWIFGIFPRPNLLVFTMWCSRSETIGVSPSDSWREGPRLLHLSQLRGHG